MDVDSKYICFLQYKTNPIITYDKSGEFVNNVFLFADAGESQNICHEDDVIYIGFFTPPSLTFTKI